MTINMQGTWTVAVKSMETFEPPQRFIISGAATGNGTYMSTPAAPTVQVTGEHWTIAIQMDRGSGFVDSPDQITFPTVYGGKYHFDIQSNFPPEDPVWDDLILTCSTPATEQDYVIYGNVSYYSGWCLFNPCHYPYLVIDTPAALAQALLNPKLRVPIEKLYPQRLFVQPPRPPGPGPDPPPFIPLVIPLQQDTALPAKIGQVLKKSAASAAEEKKKGTEAAGASFQAMGSFPLAEPQALAFDFDRIEVANLADRLRLKCETGPLPGVVLQFQEYDRTNAELAGGPYTGQGDRENLGVCATDKNGNYLFRFRRSLEQYIHEATFDVAPGEDVLAQIPPDVIAQLLVTDPMQPAGYCYESAPYWNIPHLREINICVPKGCVGRLPTACQGGNAIQAIGNIFIGPPQADGSRIGFNNTINQEGKITARSSLPDVPPARCASWAGCLDFFACFIDHPEVTQYTIRYQAVGQPNWNFFQELYSHPEVALIAQPGYSGTKIGPFTRALEIDGVPNTPAPVYDNIENNPAFILTHRDRKAWISSWVYPPVHQTLYGARQYGSVRFRIEGYDSTGAKVAGADDIITLYIDNNPPDFDIASVEMQGQPGDTCALFNLNGQSNTPLTVKFRANQLEGFLYSYNLGVRKGNLGGLLIDSVPIPPSSTAALIAGTYVHGDDKNCNSFEGTFDDPQHDGSGYIVADIVVANNGRWLEVDQPFCTFAVQLSCSMRLTNGYNEAVQGYGPIEYLLGIKAS